MIKPVHNKLYLKILPESEQPQKSFLNQEAELLRLYEVVDKGSTVSEEIHVGDIVTCYINHVRMVDSTTGFCTDRDPVFVNNRPRTGKIVITESQRNGLTAFSKAKVLKSESKDISDGANILYLAGQSHILPDSTEIISETQIFADVTE